jgi:hypothetical protein
VPVFAARTTRIPPRPLAYALLRLAEAHMAAGDRDCAAAAVQEAYATADRCSSPDVTARG